jgi:hypothetical protein
MVVAQENGEAVRIAVAIITAKYPIFNAATDAVSLAPAVTITTTALLPRGNVGDWHPNTLSVLLLN